MATEGKGWVRGIFGGLWSVIDGTRRLIFNLLFLALVVVAIVVAVSGPPAIKERTVLVINPSGPLVEQRSGSAREAALKQARGEDVGQTRLRDVLWAFEAAAKDERIERVLLVLDDLSGGGLATQREVAAAIERFKASGKQVVAWGDAYDQRQYYIASHASEVWLHPMGMVGVTGYGRLRNYYRDAFDRLGVAANVVRVGKYKNAAEPYFAIGPSPETMEADAFLYDALWKVYTDGVEKARKLKPGALAEGIEKLPELVEAAGGNIAKLTLQLKLVDALRTRDEMRAALIERGVEDTASKSFRQVSLAEYVARNPAPRGPAAIAVVVAEGEIVDGLAPAGRVGGRSTGDLIRKAREDEQVKALVLRVNSPGGSATASEQVRRELELTRKAGKPVIVSMSDVAASGGYWISMSADEVIADAATITGSIGVFGMIPTGDGLMDKLSLHAAGYGTTWLATAGDPRKPLDPRYQSLVQSTVNRIYVDFTGLVAAARKSTPEKIDEVAQGRVWTGAQAQERQLVDRLGSFADAVAAARARAKLGDDALVGYVEREGGRFDRLIEWFAATVGVSIGDALGHSLAQTLRTAAPLAALPVPGGAVGQDLQWVGEVVARRDPFAAYVHCLCAAEP